MQSSRHSGRIRERMLVAVCLVLCLPASLGSVKIDFIELFENDRVLIHFDTEANRSYQLQYTETLTNGVPAGNWTNLFVAPSTPFPGHYVIVDTRLRPQRFYRLRVLP